MNGSQMFALLSVTIRNHATLARTKTFNITYKSGNTHSPHDHSYTAELVGGETVENIFDKMKHPDRIIRSATPLAVCRKQITEIIQDLIHCTGGNPAGNFYHSSPKAWDSPDALNEFQKRWTAVAFKEALLQHNVKSKLTYESALTVVQEQYIVQPLMES